MSIIGIAFFTFIVAFMRSTVYMYGECQAPRWNDLDVSLVVGMVAVGIGVGSPLVGYLSGGKVEVGLVPIGSIGMAVVAAVAAVAVMLGYVPGLIACIVLIGLFTGFYLVPLYSLLQHRAPKTSKGDWVATSNFLNVTGAIAATVLFYADVPGGHLVRPGAAAARPSDVCTGPLGKVKGNATGRQWVEVGGAAAAGGGARSRAIDRSGADEPQAGRGGQGRRLPAGGDDALPPAAGERKTCKADLRPTPASIAACSSAWR